MSGPVDYLLIGAQRAGTTSLYEHITEHPRAMRAGDKEVRFFDNNFHMGTAWYRDRLLGDARDGRKHSPFAATARRLGRKLLGEATPYYLFHPAVPQRVSATAPDVGLIVLLRDPVSRAYSQYRHSVRRGREDLSFEDAIEAEPARLAGEDEKLLADPRYTSYSHRHHSYLARGIYADQLLRWLDHFDPARFLILSTDGFGTDPRATLATVYRFLGLPDHRSDTYEKHNVSTETDEMSPATAESLRSYFRPHNERLFDLLSSRFGVGPPF